MQSTKGVVCLGLLIHCLACNTSTLSRDAYSETMECEPKSEKVPADAPVFPSIACLDALKRVVAIDEAYEEFDKQFIFSSYGAQESRLLSALLFLRNAPLSIEIDGSVWGVAPARRVLPQSLLRLFVEHPEMKQNQIVFNYVVNSTRLYKLDTDLSRSSVVSAYYSWDRSTTLLITDSPSPVFDAVTLLHEARHSESGPHQIYCYSSQTPILECDMDFEGPHGWTAAYAWGLLRANQIRKWQPWRLTEFASNLFISISFINSLAPETRQLKEHQERYVPTSYSESYQGMPSYREIIRQEQLSKVEFERRPFQMSFGADYFSQALSICKTPNHPSEDCLKFIDKLVGFDNGLLSLVDFTPKMQARFYLLLLLQFNLILPLEKTILDTIPGDKLVAPDFLYLKNKYGTMSISQLFFNYVIESFHQGRETAFRNLRFFSRSFVSPFSGLATMVYDAHFAMGLIHKLCEAGDDTPECEPTNLPVGWDATISWSILQTNAQAARAGTPFLDEEAERVIAERLCGDLNLIRQVEVKHFESPLWARLTPPSCYDDSVAQRLARE